MENALSKVNSFDGYVNLSPDRCIVHGITHRGYFNERDVLE